MDGRESELMKCPYCLLRQTKPRYALRKDGSGSVSHSCDDCQKRVDKAVKNTCLVQRGLLAKYRNLEDLYEARTNGEIK